MIIKQNALFQHIQPELMFPWGFLMTVVVMGILLGVVATLGPICRIMKENIAGLIRGAGST